MLRILHLEDSLADRELIERALKRQSPDHEVWWATNQTAFTTILEKVPFDVVLCDGGTPEFDGKEALELVRKRQPKAAFIFVTGHAEGPVFEKLKRLNADAVFSKDDLPLVGKRIIDALGTRSVGVGRRETTVSRTTQRSDF